MPEAAQRFWSWVRRSEPPAPLLLQGKGCHGPLPSPVSLTRGQRSLSEPTPKPNLQPNLCHSSSFSQPGLAWGQSSWAKPLCPLCPRAEPCAAPCAPLAPQLLLQGQLCRFPHPAAFSRNFPGCLHCGNPDGYFTSFTQSARRGRAGKPLLTSGRAGKLWGVWVTAGCCRELYPEAAGQAVSQAWCLITAVSGFRALVTQTQCNCFNLGAGSTSGLPVPTSAQGQAGWGSG